VLAVIDDEAGVHGDMQHAHAVGCLGVVSRFEPHLGIDRSREGGEDVILRIVDDVACQFGNAGLIEGALSTHFGDQLVFVEEKHLGNQAKWTHRNEVLATCLDASNGREGISKTAGAHRTDLQLRRAGAAILRAFFMFGKQETNMWISCGRERFLSTWPWNRHGEVIPEWRRS
jgi:hypothetical protein